MSLYSPLSAPSAVRLRPATLEDADLLAGWDRQPHVIACSTDDPDADIAFGGIPWREELADQSDISFYRIAEVDGRPIGVMQKECVHCMVNKNSKTRFTVTELSVRNLGAQSVRQSVADILK